LYNCYLPDDLDNDEVFGNYTVESGFLGGFCENAPPDQIPIPNKYCKEVLHGWAKGGKVNKYFNDDLVVKMLSCRVWHFLKMLGMQLAQERWRENKFIIWYGKCRYIYDKLSTFMMSLNPIQLETHYDNPEKLENVSFSTGVQFYYTNNTR
jgi:hypothetical protein